MIAAREFFMQRIQRGHIESEFDCVATYRAADTPAPLVSFNGYAAVFLAVGRGINIGNCDPAYRPLSPETQ